MELNGFACFLLVQYCITLMLYIKSFIKNSFKCLLNFSVSILTPTFPQKIRQEYSSNTSLGRQENKPFHPQVVFRSLHQILF